MTRTIGWCGVALLALAACKGKQDAPAADPPPPPPPATQPADAATAAPPVDAPTSARALVPCPPDAAAVKAAAEKIFALAGTIGEAQCAALWVEGTARWLVELGYADAAGVDHFYGGLVNASTGQATWNETYEAPEGVSLDKQEVVDLDGDGADELLTTRWGGSHGMAWGTLEVRQVHGGKLHRIAELKLGYTNEGAVAIGLDKKPTRCESTVELLDGPAGAQPTKQIVITGARPVGAPKDEDCARLGRHAYAYDGKALTEISP